MSFTNQAAGTFSIPALAGPLIYDASCSGTTSITTNGIIIDRLGLPTRYNAVQPQTITIMDMGTSTGTASKYGEVTVLLQHSNTSSTSASGAVGWANLSTQYQSCAQPGFVFHNTTSTVASSCQNNSGYMSSQAGCSSSTGLAYFPNFPTAYPVDTAYQFLRIQVVQRIESATSSGAGQIITMGQLIFQEPQYAYVGSPVQATVSGTVGVPVSTSTGIVIKSTS